MTPDYTAEFKKFRTEVDTLIQKAAKLKNTSEFTQGKRELALVHTKLQEAKMWIGKVLEEHGHALPAEFQDKAPVNQ